MDYRSPINIIANELVDISLLSPDYLKQLRKQRLLELQMFGGELKVGDEVYTKDDIIKAFDTLDNQEELKYHSIIWQNKDLHQFLISGDEQYVEGVKTVFSYNPEIKDPEKGKGFKEFISPYLANKIKRKSLDFLKEHDFQKLINYSYILNNISLQYREEALSNIKYQIDYWTEKLDALEHKRIPYNRNEFAVFMNKDLYLFFNMLPQEMAKSINQFARDLINSCITVEKEQLQYVYRVYRGFVVLNCEESLKKIILGNYEIYKKRFIKSKGTSNNRRSNGPIVQKKKKSGKTIFGTVAFIILIMVFGIRLLKTFTRSNSYDYDSKVLDLEIDKLLTDLDQNVEFKEVLTMLTSKQDSNSKVPTLFSTYFKDENIPNYGDSIEVLNNSSYDIKVLVKGISGPYASRVIKANTKGNCPYINEEFAIYIGNNWDSSITFYGNSRNIKGGFREFDTNTTKLLTQIFDDKYNVEQIEIQESDLGVNVIRKNSYGEPLHNFDLEAYITAVTTYSASSYNVSDESRILDFEMDLPIASRYDDLDIEPKGIYNFTSYDLYVLNRSYSTASRSELVKAYSAGEIAKLSGTHSILIGKDWNPLKKIKVCSSKGCEIINGGFDDLNIKGSRQKFEKIYSADNIIVMENSLGRIVVSHNGRMDNILKTNYVTSYINAVNANLADNFKEHMKFIKEYPFNFSKMFTQKPDLLISQKVKVYNKTDYDIRLISLGYLDPYSSKTIKKGKSGSYQASTSFNLLIGKNWNDSKPIYDGERLFFGGFEQNHPRTKDVSKNSVKVGYDAKAVIIEENDGQIEIVIDNEYQSDKKISL